MPSDLQHALDLQQQYDGVIPLRTVAEVDYSVMTIVGGLDILLQGTSNLDDAKRDLETLMTATPFGRVHQGALSGLLAVYHTEIVNIPKNTFIRFKGHSLGAMEAAILACICHGNGFTNLECVTFESPLWGDAQAVDYLNQIKNRTYQNYFDLFKHDIFTTIPLHLPEIPYVPPPNRVQFWAEPTANNEWAGAPVNVQAHSLKDCVIPGLRVLGV